MKKLSYRRYLGREVRGWLQGESPRRLGCRWR